MLDSGFCGKTFGRHILRLAQESHGPQPRMRYHALDALASDAARLNHEMLVVSAIHHFCPLRLIQVEVGRLPSTILPSTQSSKWNNGGRDCADGFMLQGSCFTGPVGTMTWPSLEAQGSSRDEDLATSFRASSCCRGCLSVPVTFVSNRAARRSFPSHYRAVKPVWSRPFLQM
jgi:hypothetical protein